MPPERPGEPREAIYIAGSVAETERVEALLMDEEIPFNLTPEASFRSTRSNVCLQGLLIEVPKDKAAHCRALLETLGLIEGIVASQT